MAIRDYLGGWLVLLGLVFWVQPSTAVEKWVVGQAENPWSEAGEMQNLEGVDGWLQPVDVSGKNLSLDLFERGGWVAGSHFTEANLRQGVDGTPDEGWGLKRLGRSLWLRDFVEVRDKQGNLRITDQFEDVVVIMDLGGRFGIDSLSFYTRPDHLVLNENAPEENWFIKKYRIYTDEGLQVLEKPVVSIPWASMLPLVENWNLLATGQRPTPSAIAVNRSVPLTRARYVALSDIDALPDDVGWEIDEFEVWGSGFALTGEFVSEVIDLGGLFNLGNLEWAFEIDPGVSVAVSTRTGTTSEPNIYHEKNGLGLTGQTEVTRAQYNRLRLGQRGTVEFDAENWEFWSAPYPAVEKTPLIASGPRRAIQFKIEFQSFDPSARPRVDFVSFDYSTALVTREAIGEIFPVEVVPGTVNDFKYVVLAVVGPENTGFDAIRISTPGRIDVQTIKNLQVGGAPVPFSAQAEEGEITVLFAEDRVPSTAVQGVDSVLVSLEFSARIFLQGTRFDGHLFDSRQPDEVAQDILPGNATAEFAAEALQVGWSFSDELITFLEVSSGIFSPNGDGVNDQVEISYSLLQLTQGARAVLSIYDLSGQMVFERSEQQTSGSHSFAWDGRDRQNNRVPPGLYIYRIEVDVDSGPQQRTGTLGLVY